MLGALSPGLAGDGPQGRQRLRRLGPLATHPWRPEGWSLLTDRAYGEMQRAHGPGIWASVR